MPKSYYSIKSDGSDLRPLDITTFPSSISLPENAPQLRPRDPPPYLSPTGTEIAYGTGPEEPSLYVVNLSTGQIERVFQISESEDTFVDVGPVCWSPDGTLKFFVRSGKGDGRLTYRVYAIARNGLNPKELFTLPEGVFGQPICSPDGQEIALASSSDEPNQNGVVVVNLNTGEIRQILHTYHVGATSNAPTSP
jgi:Tol biopolymer transport system component